MPNARIELPKNMIPSEILKFVRDLDYYSNHDRVILNMPEKAFFSPSTMLLISLKILYLRKRCPRLTFIFNGWEKHEYLAHMGFFSMCGYNHGRDLGEAWGSENYLPLTELERQDFYENERDRFQELPDLVQRHVNRVAEVLSRDKQHDTIMFDVLSYSVREIFRNVFEHSGANSLFFCAQYWPKTQKVEFAIADFGKGIRSDLASNPNFRFSSDKEALEYALLPGVSGKTHLPRTSDTWFNSGYGLYMTNRLARHGGNFMIVSGDTGIHFSEKTKSNFSTSFPGTMVKINFHIPRIGDVQKRLSEFREDGKRLAASIKGSGNRPPSAMSLLLRRDYQRGS